ncbi:hypothetical protein [Bradyrhizobium sp. CCBAU 51753]|uniref:hypothetical protein n=1 Tax=Bradyrhizobium sp. CCBAU 51753 TaxID=1325100 RepID=UPI00188C1596|nr:hypothetical protein [Bradyrhizobium sp. CCBAU 51753]
MRLHDHPSRDQQYDEQTNDSWHSVRCATAFSSSETINNTNQFNVEPLVTTTRNEKRRLARAAQEYLYPRD